jgi:hypothetical protein
MKHFFLILILIFATNYAMADDGMWLPHQMKQLGLEEKGLILNPDEMFREDGTGIMSAIVYLGGGTGEFVSSNGLILTNHHVAYRAIQRASTPEKNYLKDGFVAWKNEEEISVPGYYAEVLLNYEEVTERVNSVLKPGMSYREIHDALDLKKKQMIAEVEKEAPDRRCKIAAMYSGLKYYLFRFKRLSDVRLVLAPPKALGNFGADIDNWMWPRHTCDFSFLRAYVSKDNVGIPYAEDNVPYHPKSVLTISMAGVKTGDFSFVMGYPGKTYRNYTLSQMEKDINTMKRNIDFRTKQIAFFEKAGQKDEKINLLYASRLKSLNNGLKNYTAKLEGFEKAGVIEIKKKMENNFTEWVNSSADRKEKYGSVLNDIEEYIKRTEEEYVKYGNINNLLSSRYGAELASQAHTILRIVTEGAKPDMERESKFQERNLSRLKLQMKQAERSYDLDTDKQWLMYALKDFKSEPKDKLPAILVEILNEATAMGIDEFVNEMYAQTVLADPEKRLQMTELTPAQLKELDDPMINFAMKLESYLSVYRENGKARDMELMELKKIYLEAMLQIRENQLASDANSTLRFTYGIVNGYVPRDAVYYEPVTTLNGVLEKDTGVFPFYVPEKIKELHQNKDFGRYADSEKADIVTCFLNETNVTGGNSGSPTLNAKGEQIGIIFDMTYESVTGDYYVIPNLQRTISVDIRYVLFVTEKFSGAKHIIDELKLN